MAEIMENHIGRSIDYFMGSVIPAGQSDLPAPRVFPRGDSFRALPSLNHKLSLWGSVLVLLPRCLMTLKQRENVVLRFTAPSSLWASWREREFNHEWAICPCCASSWASRSIMAKERLNPRGDLRETHGAWCVIDEKKQYRGVTYRKKGETGGSYLVYSHGRTLIAPS